MKETDKKECTGGGDCADCKKENTPENPDRRKVLGFMVGVINVGLLGAVAGPVLGFVGSPLTRKTKFQWVSIIALEKLPDQAVQEVSFSMNIKDGYQDIVQKYSVFLKRTGKEVICIDPACTHLGCRVKYQDDQDRFMCPCHGGVFDSNGQVVSGPPPHALERHATKVEAGQVWIRREV